MRRRVFETPQPFAVLWAGAARVFLWTGQDDPKGTGGDAAFFVARAGGRRSLRIGEGRRWHEFGVKSLRRRTPEVAATAIVMNPSTGIVTVH